MYHDASANLADGGLSLRVTKRVVSGCRIRALLVVVLGGSDIGDQRDASSLGVAVEPALAEIAPIQRAANGLPGAVRAVGAVFVDLRHPGCVTARSVCGSKSGRRARAAVVGA
jgi:hypothetical protein